MILTDLNDKNIYNLWTKLGKFCHSESSDWTGVSRLSWCESGCVQWQLQRSQSAPLQCLLAAATPPAHHGQKVPNLLWLSISGIFLISYRKCLDCELGFSGPNLLLFSVFWQWLCCRHTKSKTFLIFQGVGKSYCLFVLSGVKAAVCSGSCSGPNLLLFSACWQRPPCAKNP